MTNNEFILTIKGYALANFGKHEEALEVFNKALKTNPNNDYALIIKGLVLGILEKYEQAIETFNMALEIDPNDEFTLKYKAFTLFNLKRHTEGLDVARKMLDIDTDEYSKMYQTGSTKCPGRGRNKFAFNRSWCREGKSRRSGCEDHPQKGLPGHR